MWENIKGVWRENEWKNKAEVTEGIEDFRKTKKNGRRRRRKSSLCYHFGISHFC